MLPQKSFGSKILLKRSFGQLHPEYLGKEGD
jgi:hypothetical protein